MPYARHRTKYAEPGSVARVMEAAIRVVDVDSDDDRAYHAAMCGLNAAIQAVVARRVREAARIARRRQCSCDARQLTIWRAET